MLSKFTTTCNGNDDGSVLVFVRNGDVLAMDEQDVRMFVLLCIGFLKVLLVGVWCKSYEVEIVSNVHVLSKYNTMAVMALCC